MRNMIWIDLIRSDQISYYLCNNLCVIANAKFNVLWESSFHHGNGMNVQRTTCNCFTLCVACLLVYVEDALYYALQCTALHGAFPVLPHLQRSPGSPRSLQRRTDTGSEEQVREAIDACAWGKFSVLSDKKNATVGLRCRIRIRRIINDSRISISVSLSRCLPFIPYVLSPAHIISSYIIWTRRTPLFTRLINAETLANTHH